MMLGWTDIVGFDNDQRTRGHRAIRISHRFIGEHGKRQRLRLEHGFGTGSVERHAEWLFVVLGTDECCRCACCFERFGDDQRDWLATVIHPVGLHEGDALKARAAGKDETGRLQTVHRLMGQHQEDAGGSFGCGGVHGLNASLADRRHNEHRVRESGPCVVCSEARCPGHFRARADAF